LNTVKRLVSVVIPAFNEEDCVEELGERLAKTLNGEDAYRFEVIIVENGSTDRTWELLVQLSEADNRFKVIQLSRNFGADGAITAGLHVARGDAVVIMMADLQEPPELIPELLRKWEAGFENVYGIVLGRPDSSLLRRMNSKLYYGIAHRLSGGLITADASDFRLVDRKVVQAVLELDESNRFIRGLFSWVGFKSVGIPFERLPRFGGESKASFRSVFRLGVHGILAHSLIPIRAITVLGVVSSLIAILVLGTLTIRFFTDGVPFDGFGTIVGLNLLGFALISMSIGILGEYIALTYQEAKKRPHFVVRESVGFTTDS
jgi:glycosyltransferase involved in cell wall biosynthesis